MLLLTSSVLSMAANTFSYKYEGTTLKYSVTEDGNGCYVINYVNYPIFIKGDVIIPEKAYDGEKFYPVVSIGEQAFNECILLTSIIIPESVTTIGEYAFYNCYNLTSINFPSAITSIGNKAFSYCKALTDFVIPDSVINIGEMAFCGCAELTTITIPKSVSDIGYCAFAGCQNLTQINVDEGNTQYASDNGVLFNKNLTSLITCPGGITGRYKIPDTVQNIEYEAFSICKGLSSITIPADIISIPKYAFYYCSGLTEIIYPVIVPLSCFDNIFEDSIYSKAVLKLLEEGVEAAHLVSPWNKFKDIRALSAEELSVSEIYADELENAIIIYDLQGRRLSGRVKGVNIINGKKVIFK